MVYVSVGNTNLGKYSLCQLYLTPYYLLGTSSLFVINTNVIVLLYEIIFLRNLPLLYQPFLHQKSGGKPRALY